MTCTGVQQCMDWDYLTVQLLRSRLRVFGDGQEDPHAFNIARPDALHLG